MSGPDRDLNFFIAGAGAGAELKKNYCRGRGSEFFLLPGPGRDLNFVFLPGLGFFLLPGPGRDLYFFIAGAEPGLKFFHCRDRGWAGIKNFEMTGAGSGLEKLKMPGPCRDQNFFIAGPGFKFSIIGAGAGP